MFFLMNCKQQLRVCCKVTVSKSFPGIAVVYKSALTTLRKNEVDVVFMMCAVFMFVIYTKFIFLYIVSS